MSPRNTVSLLDFTADEALGPERDIARFAAAMAYCREHEGTTLIVPPGEYTLTSTLARETQRKVMAGEYGDNPQRIMFNPNFEYTRGISFAGQTGTTLIGYGVTLMADGFLEPVSVRDCADVTVKGITVDHARKPYSKGEIIAAEKRRDGNFDVTVRLDADCPIQEKSPISLRYVFYSKHTNLYFTPSASDISVKDRYTIHLVTPTDRVEETGECYIGMEYYTVHTYHSRPAILIEYAKNIRLEDVTVHSQPGMGIVGNRSEDVVIHGLSVVPSAGHHFSTNTDATHFTSMKGLLRLEYSVFDGQGDDFINIHNYYHTVTPIDKYTCFIHTDAVDGTHAQSLDYPDTGDILELTDRASLEVRQTYTVLECEPDYMEYRTRIRLDKPLPENAEKYFLADVTRLPRLEVIGCNARNHFARSILVKTRDVLLEGNTFTDVFGPAIVIAAEASWCEGVCAENVIVRRNRIVNTRIPWGEAGGVVVKADCRNPVCPTIRNIVIEDNIIDCPKAEHGIYVRNAIGVTVRRNRIVSRSEPIHIEKCSGVEVQ